MNDDLVVAAMFGLIAIPLSRTLIHSLHIVAPRCLAAPVAVAVAASAAAVAAAVRSRPPALHDLAILSGGGGKVPLQTARL